MELTREGKSSIASRYTALFPRPRRPIQFSSSQFRTRAFFFLPGRKKPGVGRTGLRGISGAGIWNARRRDSSASAKRPVVSVKSTLYCEGYCAVLHWVQVGILWAGRKPSRWYRGRDEAEDGTGHGELSSRRYQVTSAVLGHRVPLRCCVTSLTAVSGCLREG